MSTYKSSHQMAWERSPLYHARLFRKEGETLTKDEWIDDFMDWMIHDCEEELTKKNQLLMSKLMKLYMDYDIDKAHAGEKEMLARWIKATKGENNEQPV